MTPTTHTALIIAAIGMAGIFVFMTLFYLLILGLDKALPFRNPEPDEPPLAASQTDNDEE